MGQGRVFKLIPDDGIIIIRQNTTSVKKTEDERGIVYTAEAGFPGGYSRDALAHTEDHDNPHRERLVSVKLPSGKNGKWLTLGESTVVVTEEQPIFREDVHAPINRDTCVKTDEAGPQAHLDGVVSEPFCVHGNIMRIKGDTAIAPRMFFGTDVSGTLGFNLIPGEKVIP